MKLALLHTLQPDIENNNNSSSSNYNSNNNKLMKSSVRTIYNNKILTSNNQIKQDWQLPSMKYLLLVKKSSVRTSTTHFSTFAHSFHLWFLQAVREL